MKKLTLNAEELAVESFHAAADAETRTAGTVHGHAPPETQQVRCTYFCTVAGGCTGLAC
jgi:hypothetical protein